MSEAQSVQRPMIEKVVGEFIGKIHDNPALLHGLRPGVCAKKAKMTVFSLTLFPFLIPASLLRLHEITLNEEELTGLLEHNIDVLENGLFQPIKTRQGNIPT